MLPFVEEVATDLDSLNDYLTFQFTLGEKTLFQGIKKLEPGHMLTIENSTLSVKKYWEVYYDIDFNHKESNLVEEIRGLMDESMNLHMRSDVPVGAYVSGGRDSSIVASLASQIESSEFKAFTGSFLTGKGMMRVSMLEIWQSNIPLICMNLIFKAMILSLQSRRLFITWMNQ